MPNIAVLLCKIAVDSLYHNHYTCRVSLCYRLVPSYHLCHLQPGWIFPSVFGAVQERHSKCFPLYVVLPKPQ